MCVSASQKSSFFQQTVVVTPPRAGGVSPRGAGADCAVANVTTPRRSLAVADAFFDTTAADARRSCECAFVHRKNRFFAGRRPHCTKSGGRKPPVGCSRYANTETRKSSALPLRTWFPTSGRADAGSPDERVRNCNCVTHTHGGLTPVAERTRPQLQLRYSHPRRADARRSCARAFVHRKNRFSPANVRTAPRAGGVSPPWDVLGMRSRNAEIQRVAVANVVSDQRRANASRWTKAPAIATVLLTPTAG
jgi:hypothetical protein